MNKLLSKTMNKDKKIETNGKCSFNHKAQLKDAKHHNKAQHNEHDSEAHHYKADHNHENELQLKKATKCKKIEIKGEDHFKNELKSEENSLKVIKFYRDGCPHCAFLGNKVYDHVNASNDYNHDEIKFLDIGVEDENIEIFKKFQIEGVPTTVFLIIKEEKIRILGQTVGSDMKDVIDELNECLKRKEV